MSLVPKAVYPFASEKGEPIFADVLAVRAGLAVTLAPGESRVAEFLPENDTVIIPNVIQVWSTGIAKVVTAAPVAFGKEIIREINFDTKPLLPTDWAPNPVQPLAEPWIVTTNMPISGTASYANPWTATEMYGDYGLFIIPEAYWADFPNQEWRYSMDWSFNPGAIPNQVYCQLWAALGGIPGSELPVLHESPWDTGPKVAAKGTYDGPMPANGGLNYGPIMRMSYVGEDKPTPWPIGEVYRIDNVKLYVVGGGPNPMRTNTYFIIPNDKQLLSVQDEITISNPAAEGGESITVIINQVVRWAQISNPGTYVGNS